MRSFLVLAAVALVGCGADYSPPISAEPPTAATSLPLPEAPPAPEPNRAPPVITETLRAPEPDRAPPEVLEAPAGGGFADPADYHLSANGACYLPNVLHVGECRCAEYEPPGCSFGPGCVLVTPGDNLCADSCKMRPDGAVEFHTFCVAGGLASEMRPR